MKWLLVALIVIPGTIADLLNAMGMKRNGEVHDFRPYAIFRLTASLARNPYVAVGVPAMAVSFFALMALLSIAKLSFAVPATASSYVLETALAKYILREHIGWRRWAGASLVGCGVLLVSLGV
jgi:drug/metabolite transporter (DMT)-like permease